MQFHGSDTREISVKVNTKKMSLKTKKKKNKFVD